MGLRAFIRIGGIDPKMSFEEILVPAQEAPMLYGWKDRASRPCSSREGTGSPHSVHSLVGPQKRPQIGCPLCLYSKLPKRNRGSRVLPKRPPRRSSRYSPEKDNCVSGQVISASLALPQPFPLTFDDPPNNFYLVECTSCKLTVEKKKKTPRCE